MISNVPPVIKGSIEEKIASLELAIKQLWAMVMEIKTENKRAKSIIASANNILSNYGIRFLVEENTLKIQVNKDGNWVTYIEGGI